MVKGLEKFRAHFAGLEDCYILIGGAACDLWMGDLGLEFRPTKDLDVVLVVEALRPEFFTRFWDFIRQAGYKGFHAGESPKNFYRFQKARGEGFPFMIELLSRNLLDLPKDIHLSPIPAGEDISSLSAILLDTVYYQYVRESRVEIDGVPTVPAQCLIPLKARAWIDLTERKAKGDEHVKDGDIAKHRADAYRLLTTLAETSTFALPATIRDDLGKFAAKFPADSQDWSDIREQAAIDETISTERLITQLRANFLL